MLKFDAPDTPIDAPRSPLPSSGVSRL